MSISLMAEFSSDMTLRNRYLSAVYEEFENSERERDDAVNERRFSIGEGKKKELGVSLRARLYVGLLIYRCSNLEICSRSRGSV